MKYTSKQVQIFQDEKTVFGVLSSFSNFSPVLADKVEGWEATDDHCSFKVQGFTIGLKIAEREPCNTIKITSDDATPFPFAFWVQIRQVEPGDTRMRLVLDVELNAMMKMLVGSKLQEAIDKIADQIATAFNTRADFFMINDNPELVN